MDTSIILGLLQNTAILLAFILIYDYSWVQKKEKRTLRQKVYTGIVLGGISIVLMITPWIQFPGLVFDTRSILLSLSGLFLGLIPTLIAAIISAIYRLSMGGAGVYMGIAVIVTSSAIGIAWNKFRPSWKEKNQVLELILLGLAVHIAMLGCSFLVPKESIRQTVSNILLPLLTIYPAGTLFLGLLMLRQYKNWENRRASEKLLLSEQRFTGLLQNTLLFSLIVDADGKISYSNDPFLKATGYSANELSGKDVFEIFVPEENRNVVRELFLKVLPQPQSFYNKETEIITKDRTRIVVSWNVTVIKDENNIASAIACIGENITIRKKAEAELILAKTKAEENDKLKSVFLTNMSHEIRTPMNAIMGFSNLLGEGNPDGEEKKKYVEIIRHAGDRLLKILNDIIDVSKLEARQLTLNPSECDLNFIFRNSFESFSKSDILKHKPEISFNLLLPADNKEPKFRCDGHRFQQVLDNLITNAIKYTEKGKIETGYRITGGTEENHIEVFVSDTGIGIPRNMNEIVFERFRQVEEGMFHEGAGLGLSISKGIVDLLGGKIWFESEPGKGTTFYFSVPYIKSGDIKTDKEVELNSPPDLKGKSIVIAEDDYNSYYYLKHLLESLKAKTIYAENGQVLIDLLHKQVPDIVFLDINMPVLSGFECLEKIKKERIKTKIIAQTAYAMPEEREKCMASGCDEYLVKPFSRLDVYRVISEVLSH